MPGQTRGGWMMEYLKVLKKARRVARASSEDSAPAVVIQTWPVLGYWDFAISRLALGRALVFTIIHDPHPLVEAIGYGRLARWVATGRPFAARALTHSDGACRIVNESAHLRKVVNLPHPMFIPEAPTGRQGEVVIRVLGQYKTDRDLQSMERLASDGPSDWRYEVVGRGWPHVAGWDVRSEFVEEHEFDSLLRDSSAILIPYLRFFQSGVAIRALEVGTPVVGPRSSSLGDLLGKRCNWLVDNSSGNPWMPAVQTAIDTDPWNVHEVAQTVYNNTLEQWRKWLGEIQRTTPTKG